MRTGAFNPNWKGGLVTLQCEYCGLPFKVRPAYAKKARFCSLKCWGATYAGKGIRRKVWILQRCKQCGEQFEVTPSHVKREVFCSKDCQFRWRAQRMSGAGNPNWNGGTRSEEYPPEFFAIRESIFQRDSYQCAVPMCRTDDPRIVVHHIDFNKKNCSPLNLITACPSCNSRANFHKNFWQVVLASVVKWRMENGEMNLGIRSTMIINP